MGRGRGKGKKQNAGDDAENGEEEKLIAHKGRGRPQKTLNNDIEEDEETEKIDVNVQYAKNSITNKDTKDIGNFDNGRKRKRSSQIEENSNAIDEESGSGAKSSTLTDDSIKPTGFRQNGNRRKGKPRRAAEAGVECN
ncbi:hypothetical protein Nepgr_021956 [Nepenthes gracilis]|uniref:Uncharacterized protein n=1 Tax=Nepenthes gracilis TaxID=150966 RepID=A0AAD3XXP7_NEPGR|nr:hypothetical protein Nepgr_021956 [Nepenthes gracilis]